MDEKIKQAIQEAVKSEQQPPELAGKILAWMQSLTEGNEDVANQTAYTERCALCFDHTIVSTKADE